MKILVTGSSGTIGTRLCESLLQQGHAIFGADIRRNEWSPDVAARTVAVDLRRREDLGAKLPADPDLIVHLAANARVYDLVVDPAAAFDNISMTFNVLEFARQRGVKKIMFASSREVYGNIAGRSHRESDATIDACESPYAASKLAGEALARSYDKCYGIGAVIFRFSNVYGMYDTSDRLVPTLIRQAESGAPITLYDPEKTLDFTYIDDCVDGIVRAVGAFDKCSGQTINIATGKGTSLAEVCEMILRLTGSRSKIIRLPSRIGEVRMYVADLAKAGSLLKYEPKVGIEEGLRRSIKWWAER